VTLLATVFVVFHVAIHTGKVGAYVTSFSKNQRRFHDIALYSSRASEATNAIREMREQISDNEEANLIMQALRGSGLNDDAVAADGVEIKLVDVGEKDDALKTVYDPEYLRAFFRKRPRAVLTRVLQVLSTGSGYLLTTAIDAVLGRLNDPEIEVKRAAQLRDTITSLGPFFIKLGQALSIRPDVLSPRSMVELQKVSKGVERRLCVS